MEAQYDIIIIGAGPAAWAAAIYLGRANLKSVVIGNPEESGMWFAQKVQNYPGFPEGIVGKQITELFIKQALKFGAENLKEEVVHAQEAKDGFKVITNSRKELFGKTIILASGKTFESSGLQREKEFLGKGIHTCVLCDGYFYKSKKVAILGSGDFAAEEAIELTNYTRDVTIISNGRKFAFSKETGGLIKKLGVKLLDASLSEILGKDKFKGLKTSEGKELSFDGLFLALGQTSTLAFAQKLGLEMSGESLKYNREGKTNVKGVWAAGSIGESLGNQISISVGEGTQAALSVIKTLKGLSTYVDHT